MKKDIFLPDLGEGIDFVDVSEVLVSSGDTIGGEDTIIILESDKATMEIPAENSGTVKEVCVSAGDQITTGAKLITMDISSSKKPKKTPEKTPEPTPEIPKPIVVEAKQTPGTVDTKAGPGVRRLSRALGINLNTITGTGEKGRITRDDLSAFINAQLTAAQTPARSQDIDFTKWGEIEKKKLTRIKRIAGDRLQGAWRNIPHVTQFDVADITKLDAYRKSLKKKHSKSGVKITFLPFLMKAAAKALSEFPDFNASLEPAGDVLVYKNYIHLGIAVDTENGLMVPVLKDVDKKSILDLCTEVVLISDKARNKKTTPDELSGGTFTISSLGGIGGTYFTPIVNPPEVAILGVSKTYTDASELLKLPVSLSYDHRVIDGAAAARFTTRLSEILGDVAYFKSNT